MGRVKMASGVVVAMVAVAGGCGPKTPSAAGGPAQAGPATPASSTPAWVLAEAPADAIGVAQVKVDAKEGDRVVIRGRIGGRAEPISGESPVMVIMDPSIPSCAENPEDACRTPWDYCCEPAEVKTANNATIQVVDAAGQPVAQSIAAAGLSPLDEVIVVGVVGPRPEPSVLTILATGVYRVR